MTELYRTYRPTTLKGIIGQPDAVKTIQGFIDRDAVPHAILFAGPSGCGKNTLAYILLKKLKCGQADFSEVNAADTRGIDTIRDIRSRMNLSPIDGECRVWLIDECHQLLAPSQSVLLKMLEDAPEHVYFMFATTDSQKLLKTIQTRCAEVRVRHLTPKELQQAIETVAGQAEIELTEEVTKRIIECSDGSARKAIMLLDQIAGIESEEDRINAVLSSDSKKQGIDIARCLMSGRGNWPEVSALLKNCEEEPETIRRIILGYASSIVLSGGKMTAKAYEILLSFEAPFYDSGKPGLVRACYEVFLK